MCGLTVLMNHVKFEFSNLLIYANPSLFFISMLEDDYDIFY